MTEVRKMKILASLDSLFWLLKGMLPCYKPSESKQGLQWGIFVNLPLDKQLWQFVKWMPEIIVIAMAVLFLKSVVMSVFGILLGAHP